MGTVPLQCGVVRMGCHPPQAPGHHPPLPAGATKPEKRPSEASPAFSRIVQPPGLRRDSPHPTTQAHTEVRLPSPEAMLWAPLTLPQGGTCPWLSTRCHRRLLQSRQGGSRRWGRPATISRSEFVTPPPLVHTGCSSPSSPRPE